LESAAVNNDARFLSEIISKRNKTFAITGVDRMLNVNVMVLNYIY